MGDQPRWPAGTPVAPGGRGPGGGRFRETQRWAYVVSALLPEAHGLRSHGQIAQYLGRGDYEVIGRAGGAQGEVEFRRYSDGGLIARKTAPTFAQNEVEASLIGRAIGAPVPAVVLEDGDMSVLMEYIDSPPSEVGPGLRRDAMEQALRTAVQYGDPGGGPQLLALLDVLINNNDRHGLNVVRRADGTLVGIDHGHAFAGAVYRAETAEPEIHVVVRPAASYGHMFVFDPRTSIWTQEWFTREELLHYRRSIEGLRGQMRAETHRGVLKVMDLIIELTPERE